MCDWPTLKTHNTDLELEQRMDEVRNIVTLALAERAAKAIKVRQPLTKLKVKSQKLKVLGEELLELIKDEVNVKEIVFDGTIKQDIELDVTITQELKEEGMVRDLIRSVQDLRKEEGLKPEDKISVWLNGSNDIIAIVQKNRPLLLKEIRATQMFANQEIQVTSKDVVIDNQKISLIIKKID